jgi:phage-related protein
MADNELSYEIQAHAGKAVTQLDRIVDSLSRIENVLNGVFEPLKRIEESISKVSGTTINLKVNTKQVDAATKKLDKMKELNGAVNEKGGTGAHQRGFVSDVVGEDIKGYADSLGKVYDDLGKNLPAVTEKLKDFEESVVDAKNVAPEFGDAFKNEYDEIKDKIKEALIQQKEYRAVIRKMENDAQNSYEAEQYAESVIMLARAVETVKEYKEQLIAVNKALHTISEYKPEDGAQYEQLKEMVSEYQELIQKRKEYQAVNEQIKDTPNLFSQQQVAETISGLSEVEKRMAEIRKTIIDFGKPIDINSEDLVGNIPSPDAFSGVSEGASNAVSKVEDLVHQINVCKQVIRDFKAEKGISTEDYDKAIVELPKLQEELKKYNEALIKASEGLDSEEFVDDANVIKSKIEELIEKIRQYKEIIRDMEGGKIPFDKASYDEALVGLPKAQKALADYKASLQGIQGKTSPGNKGINAWRALATAVNTATRSMNNIADAGIKAAKAVSSPIMGLGSVLKNETSRIAKVFTSMHKAASKAFKGMSKLWETFLKKFRNYIIFKIISAIIKGLQEATNSLAQFSKATGTLFNSSISNIIADFAMIGRAILGAVEPIINKVVPIFDMLAEKIANVSNIVSQFFAALGGQGYAMKAKKRIDNYAESLDKAKKSAKQLTLGIDELNVISDKKDDSDDEKNYMDEWEVTPIDPAVMEFADKIKDKFQDLKDWLKLNFGDLWDDLFGNVDLKQLAKDLWKPIGDAWEATKDRIGEGFSHMVNSIGKLAKDIGRDFMEVWDQPETTKIFENIGNAIADIMDGVGYLADNFRKAWNENKTGKKILEDIRDIILIITEWVAKAAKYFKDWAKTVDFEPLLNSFERLLSSLKKIVDFVMGVLYDIFTMAILKWVKFLIEEGIPLLNEQFAKIADGFPADKVRANLQKIWKAIEKLGEEIFKGVALALGDIGTMFNKFLDSKRFEDFVNTIATIMGKLDSEDVRKIIDGIAIAIGDLATALIDFVNSDEFMSFIDAIDSWLSNASAQDIADILKNVALAIALFKFAGFVGPGLTAFLTFIGALKRLDASPVKLISDLASGIGKLDIVQKIGGKLSVFSTALGDMISNIPVVGSALSGLGGIMSALAPIIGTVFVGAIVAAAAALIVSGGNVEKAVKLINNALKKIGNIDFKKIADDLASKFAGMINKVFEVLNNIDWKEVWDIITELFLALVSGIATLIADIDWSNVVSALVQCTVGLFASVITHLPEILGVILQLALAIGSALVEALFGVFKGLYESFTSIGADIIGGIFKGIMDTIAGVGKWIKEHIVDPFVNAIKSLFGIASPSKVMAEIGGFLIEGLIQGITDMIDAVFEVIGGLVDGIVALFTGCVDLIMAAWDGFTEFISGICTAIITFFTDAYNAITEIWGVVATWFNDTVIIPIQTFFSTMWDIIVEWFTTAWTNIQAVWNTVATWFNDTVIIPIQTFFSGMWDMIVQWFTDAWNNISAIWGVVAQWFNDNVIVPIQDFFSNMWGAIIEWFQNAHDEAVRIWGVIATWFNDNVITPIQNFFDAMWQAVVGFFQSAYDNAIAIWEGLCEWFNNTLIEPLKAAWDEAWQAIQKFFEDAYNAVTAIWEDLKNWFETTIIKPLEELWDQTWQAITGFFDAAAKAAKDLWQDVADWFNDNVVVPLKDFFEEGLAAIFKFFEDCWKDIKAVWEAVASWFNDTVIEPLKAIFDEGLKAIKDFWDNLWNDIVAIWEAALVWFDTTVIAPLRDGFDACTSAISGFFTDLWNGISSGAEGMFGALSNAAQAALNFIKGIIDTIKKGIDGLLAMANGAKETVENAKKAVSNGVNAVKNVVTGKGFATGGFPEDGMFFANSSELVGKFTNGKTAVANNDQIVQGISSGVEQAITSSLSGYLMGIQNNQRQQMNQKTSITLDGRELVGALDNRKSRNGFSFT